MKNIIAIILLIIIAFAVISVIPEIPFGVTKTKVGGYYTHNGISQTGAVNIVTSVVLDYRGFDTLGEVTVLFVAALGLGAVFGVVKRETKRKITPASVVLSTGCKLLFPFILLFGVYMFLHGHLSPGGGFQGGAVIASGFLLIYLGCPGKSIKKSRLKFIESLGGLVFVIVGLLGLNIGGYFLLNFLPKGVPGSFLSAGIIPIIYIAIGFKVGAELTGIVDDLTGEIQ
jgi:multicomponent Na+:H+ antiporter subunit B